MGARREVQITIPVERFQDLVAAPFSWSELARMSAMPIHVGDEQFWRVQILDVEGDECFRSQACVRAVSRSYSMRIEPMQCVLPAHRDEPKCGIWCTEQTDQESPRRDPNLMFCGVLSEWQWVRSVHYTHRWLRWERRWRMVMCMLWTEFGGPHARISATQVVLSSQEHFRNILPFLVKMRYECVSNRVMRQLYQEESTR